MLFPVPLQPPFPVLIGQRDHYVGWPPFALRLRPPPVLCAGTASGAAAKFFVLVIYMGGQQVRHLLHYSQSGS